MLQKFRWSFVRIFVILLISLLLISAVESDGTSVLNDAKTIPDTHLKRDNNKTVNQPTVVQAKNENFKHTPDNSTPESNRTEDSLESSDTIWPIFGGYGGYGGYGGFGGRRWGGGWGYRRWGGGWGGYRPWGGGWGRGWGYPRYWSYWG